MADDPVQRIKCIMECVRQAKLAVLFLSNTQGSLKCGLSVWLIWLMKCRQKWWVSLTGGGSESPEDICFVLFHHDYEWCFSQQHFNQPTSENENDDSSEHSPCRSRRAHCVSKKKQICVRTVELWIVAFHSAYLSCSEFYLKNLCRGKFYHWRLLWMHKNMVIKMTLIKG